MTEKDRIEHLESILAQMLRPVNGIPFSVVIKSLSSHDVIPFDDGGLDAKLVEQLSNAATFAGRAVQANPIRRPRPNEVGNDMEPFVQSALRKVGLSCERPLTKSGKGRSTGYPDLLVIDDAGRPCYVECKIYNSATKFTTQRSFYLSPSTDFKVCYDARHIVIGFEMVAEAVSDTSRDSFYHPAAFSIIDVHDLECDVKYEFNSDNKRLYSASKILASGSL